MMKKKTLAMIVGPTAVGKTEVSISLAKKLPAEIISADSIQIYKGLDIGSAKPKEEEKAGIPHHMMDIISPMEKGYSVAIYQNQAFEVVEKVFKKRKQILVVGGTGFYIQALSQYMDFSQADCDIEFREKWMKRESLNPGCAHEQLKICDSIAAEKLHPNDKKRIIRALEINHFTGSTLKEHQNRNLTKPAKYKTVKVGLTMPRDLLYRRIDMRVDMMIQEGLVDEVNQLMKKGISPQSSSMQGLGYKEIIAMLQGKQNEQQAIAAIKLGTRHFAKRQWTWFRRDANIRWFDKINYNTHEQLIIEILNYYAINGIDTTNLE